MDICMDPQTASIRSGVLVFYFFSSRRKMPIQLNSVRTEAVPTAVWPQVGNGNRAKMPTFVIEPF